MKSIRGRVKYFKKNLLQCQVLYYNSHVDCLGIKSGCCKKPVINYLSYSGGQHVTLTLCWSNLKPYCMGRKAAFFSVGI